MADLEATGAAVSPAPAGYRQLIEILSKIRYKLEDSFECYEFMKGTLDAEGKIKQALGPLFTLNKEKVAQALLMQVEYLKVCTN